MSKVNEEDQVKKAPEEDEKAELKEILETEFPLSGGEPNVTYFEFGGDDEEDEDEKKDKEKK